MEIGIKFLIKCKIYLEKLDFLCLFWSHQLQNFFTYVFEINLVLIYQRVNFFMIVKHIFEVEIYNDFELPKHIDSRNPLFFFNLRILFLFH